MAVIEVRDHIEFDSVIIWDEGYRRVAYAYKDGHTQRTAPMTGETIEQDVEEVQTGFQIRLDQLGSVTTAATTADRVPVPTRVAVPVTSAPISTIGERWGLDR